MPPDPCVWHLQSLGTFFRIFGSTTDSCKHDLAWQATLYSTKQPCYALAVCILLRAMYHNLANTMKMNYLILFIYVMHRVHSSIIAFTNVTILTSDYHNYSNGLLIKTVAMIYIIFGLLILHK